MIPKFRAWDKQKKHFIDDFEIDMEGTIFVRNFYCGSYYDTDFPVAELMQSTGLKDKNGVEIFEKDIVKNKDGRLAIVKRHGSYASFIYDWIDELEKPQRDWQPLYLSYMKFEVIGNIWEHPHLLDGAE